MPPTITLIAKELGVGEQYAKDFIEQVRELLGKPVKLRDLQANDRV